MSSKGYKPYKEFDVAICPKRYLRLRCNKGFAKKSNLFTGKRIQVTELQVHEEELRKISVVNPYSLLRYLLNTYLEENRKHTKTACRAEQTMRVEACGVYNNEKQVQSYQRCQTLIAMLNSCTDTKTDARDPERPRDTNIRRTSHPKVIRVASLIYICAIWRELYKSEDFSWLPKSITVYLDNTFKVSDEVTLFDYDLMPQTLDEGYKFSIDAWLCAWLNFLSKEHTLIPPRMVSSKHNQQLESVLLANYYMALDVPQVGRPDLPKISIKKSEQVPDEEVQEVVTACVETANATAEVVVVSDNADEEPEQLTDNDIFPQADGETIVVPAENTTDNMLTAINPKQKRLKFPIRASAAFMTWRFELRADREVLESYCKVVLRIIKTQYPDLRIEINVEGVNTVCICVRDYDLEESYPLVDYTIDLDSELEKPINKLTDDRLFRRIRVLEGIVDKCHELFYELCRTEYLLRKTL